MYGKLPLPPSHAGPVIHTPCPICQLFRAFSSLRLAQTGYAGILWKIPLENGGAPFCMPSPKETSWVERGTNGSGAKWPGKGEGRWMPNARVLRVLFRENREPANYRSTFAAACPFLPRERNLPFVREPSPGASKAEKKFGGRLDEYERTLRIPPCSNRKYRFDEGQRGINSKVRMLSGLVVS